MENNIQELIAGFKAPAITLYYLLTHLNYRIIGECLFAASIMALLYLSCYGWVIFCIRLSDNSKEKENKSKWMLKK